MNLRYHKIHQAILLALFVSASADVSAAWFSNAPDSQFLSQQQYVYDAEGRLDRVAALDGTESRFAYDKVGRLSQLSIKPPAKLSNWYSPKPYVARFGYDANSNLIEVADGAGKTQYAYDKQNRPEAVTDTDGRILHYSYDAWDNLKQMEFADGKLSYDYDVLGKLTRASDGQAEVTYEHLGNERQLIRRLPNGIRSITQYSPLGQIESIRHEDARGAVLAEFRYQYDAKDRVTVAEETTPSGTVKKTYEYDLMGRLVKYASTDGSAVSYEYDAMGNRTAEIDAAGKRTDYHYDSIGRLLSAGAVEYVYDDTGNLSSKQENGAKTGYRFDTAGRLVEVEGKAGIIRYVYDAEGKRIRRESPQGITQYLTHRLSPLSQVVAEYDGNGKLKRQFSPGLTPVVQRDANGSAIYLLEDRLGSVRCVVDADGKVQARYDYSPFGLPKLTEGSDKTDLLYTGEPLDRETGLIYLRARYYDPASGRFISQDPVAGNVLETQSLNRYAYANNDPVNFKDPEGLSPCPSNLNCYNFQPPPGPPPFSSQQQSQLTGGFRSETLPHTGYYPKPSPIYSAGTAGAVRLQREYRSGAIGTALDTASVALIAFPEPIYSKIAGVSLYAASAALTTWQLFGKYSPPLSSYSPMEIANAGLS